MVGSAIVLGIVLALGISLAIFLYATRKSTHLGNARLGTVTDAEKSGLTASRGLVFGKFGSVTLMSDDAAHMLLVGPTRSGKGVTFIVPNGVMWSGSSIWFDPKRENFAILAAYRLRACWRRLCVCAVTGFFWGKFAGWRLIRFFVPSIPATTVRSPRSILTHRQGRSSSLP